MSSAGGYSNPNTFSTTAFTDIFGGSAEDVYRPELPGSSYVTPPPSTHTMGPPIIEEHFSEPNPEDDPMEVVDPPPQMTPLPQKRPHFISQFLHLPFGQQGSTTPPTAKKQAKKVWGKKGRKNKKGKEPSPEAHTGPEILRMCKTGRLPNLTFPHYMGLVINAEFFKILLADDPVNSDLEDMHIDSWVSLLQKHRGIDTRWTIMHSMFFQYILIEHQGPASVFEICNGSEGTSWALLDRVYIPICLHPRHWLLGVFELDTMIMILYDSDKDGLCKQQLAEQMKTFKTKLYTFFWLIGDTKRRELTSIFRTKIADQVPQRAGLYVGCDVWVCRNAQKLINNEEIWVHPNETDDEAMNFRRHMAESIYVHCLIG